jgi:hypothetical protein
MASVKKNKPRLPCCSAGFEMEYVLHRRILDRRTDQQSRWCLIGAFFVQAMAVFFRFI